MPRISITSDVHLEFGQANIKNTDGADVLILAGDICIAEDLKRHPEDPIKLEKKPSERLISAMQYRDFFRECAKEFNHVVYILGNHEHYDGEIDTSYNIIKDAMAGISPNIHVLEDEVLEINNVLFLCATMWTDMNKSDGLSAWHCGQNMSDYHVIRVSKDSYRRLRPSDTMGVNFKSRQFFEYILRQNHNGDKKPVVCVTHHAPTSMSISDYYRGDTLMNGAYYTDLSEMILDNPEIRLWAHGHMHNKSDYMVGDTRVICNPRGYYGEQTTVRDLELVTVDV